MELFILWGLALFLSMSLGALFLLYNHKSKSNNNPALPPDTLGWPVVGETWDFLSTGWKGEPEKFIFDRLAKYAPNKVFKTSILGEKMVIMCSPSSNKFLFTNENKLVRMWFPKSFDKIFMFSYENNTKIRQLGIFNLLKAEALQRFIPVMDKNAIRHFAAHWEGKDEVKVYPLTKRYTFHLALRLLLGILDPAQIDKLESWYSDIITAVFAIPINFPGTRFHTHKAIKASNLITKELMSLVKQRKEELLLIDDDKHKARDILSQMLLLNTDEGGGGSGSLSETDIASTIMGLIVGGRDTVTALCTYVVKYLAEFPRVYEAVYKEQMEIAKSKGPGELLNWKDIQKMKYSWNMASEVLRVAPPGSGGFKEAIHDFVYEGFLIPKDWKIYWSLHATQKDPEYFPHPERFDPSRFEGKGGAIPPYTYVPFATGARMCPGNEYARLEVLVFMHNLVKRSKLEKCIPDETNSMHITIVPANGLPVRLHPHSTVSDVQG